ncbi:hypothetical protein HanIR_Chr12g0575701 [Helianthus annuus]|nr:hypothetical protein HanIR_Chr12g0575701 [Helianthus annuus]
MSSLTTFTFFPTHSLSLIHHFWPLVFFQRGRRMSPESCGGNRWWRRRRRRRRVAAPPHLLC